MKEIIFATKNKGKIKEIQAILGGDYIVKSMEEAGIDIDILEDGKTFEENAIKKAVEIMNFSNKIVLADDSGLEIDYLNGEPGVYSARYMGEDTPYEIKNNKILEMLKDVEEEKRGARFVSVIALAMPNNEPITTRGAVEGIIGYEIKGANGFGYDPIFYIPELKCTSAELSLEEKNKISHRGKALQQMKKILEKMV
ncbi:XTP/dITP diphosphatase [uncultured Tyzzerella sp.]|uniref:XTP/dITP diphosphatase n=1 Tax=uncultured Tyzzerella sp. TaxID=2321398 RepID=UPI002942F0EE|nr:XTP/dITP diphosphatase [uncultured Tyzzerella sp.]